MDDSKDKALEKAIASSFSKPKRRVIRRKGRPKLSKGRVKTPEEEERIRIMNQNRLVSVQLHMVHKRNGINYGPGLVKVPRALAMDFMSSEERARRVDDAFLNPKGAIIGPRVGGRAHVIRVVPLESMSDDSMDFIRNSTPATRVDKKGNIVG